MRNTQIDLHRSLLIVSFMLLSLQNIYSDEEVITDSKIDMFSVVISMTDESKIDIDKYIDKKNGTYSLLQIVSCKINGKEIRAIKKSTDGDKENAIYFDYVNKVIYLKSGNTFKILYDRNA